MANTKVTGDVIANGTISTVHLADDAITAAKLDSTATGITFADLTVDTDTLYVDAANNRVGIGTTTNISSPLTVQTDGSASSISIIGRDNGTSDEAIISFYEYDGTTRNSYIIKDGGDLAIATGTGGSPLERMRITSTGNVGIGRTDPNARLDIKGAGGGTGLTFETSDASNNQTFYIQDGGRAGLKYWPFTIAMDSGTSHATGARFQVATTSGDFVILNDGKTGIGTTSPATYLDIAGDSIAIGTAYNFSINANNDGNWGFQVQRTDGQDDYNTRMKFYPAQGSQRKLGFWNAQTSSWMGYFDGSTNSNNNFIINGGNVGIGETGTRNARLLLNNAGSQGAPQLMLVDSGDSGKQSEIRFDSGNLIFDYWGGTSRSEKMRIKPDAVPQVRIGDGDNEQQAAIRLGGENAGGGRLFFEYNGDNSYIDSYGGHGSTQRYRDLTIAARDIIFTTGITSGSEKMRITSGGKTLIGITSEQNAGKVQIQSGSAENGGILDIVGGGWYRYYTRVCHNATSTNQAGYWHIKTNIVANSNTMFLAKFYGYIYGSAQIVDLTHAGYAYSGTSSVINQATTNNGSDPNASSAVYISANGSKVTFRIAFGSGSTFSTYFAGVFMDIAFPSPAGQGNDFEIEAQSFSQSTTVY